MIIDLRKSVIRTYLRRFILMIVFATLVIVSMLGLSLQKSYLGMTKYHLALIIGIIYVCIAVFEFVLELYYIYFSDEGENIILRFFSTGYMNKKKQVIQIPKKLFTNYEIEESMFGLKKKLILKQQLKTNEVKYPPVSVSLMNNKQLQLLRDALDKYIVTNS